MSEKKARDKPSRVVRFLKDWGTDLMLLIGAAMVALGAGLIYGPAGWIAGGALTIAGGVLLARGERGDGDG